MDKTFTELVHARPIEKPAGQQQASTVRSSIICQANLHAVLWEFMSVSCTNYHISFYTGVSSLTNDTSVGYTNFHSVFGCVVLIFIQDYRAFPGIVISFTRSSSLEVSLIFDNLTKSHPAEQRPASIAHHSLQAQLGTGGEKLAKTL
ncbi:hypothetical protein mRhiFer1_008745 [Rhinolophus ferrumequinum]|uniref:Uncharacterized protein n=1 Tax=Rhinolophus ferrumequinum TaxID=59479 RepID=A0A7J7TLY8_RHIFE|nr:hypothetical protein mRhiFer1_008745 [Rhinolophus ferrumequinum]